MFGRTPNVPPIEGTVNIWGVGEQQVYGICIRTVVYSEVVEARSNYEKSYLRWFRSSL